MTYLTLSCLDRCGHPNDVDLELWAVPKLGYIDILFAVSLSSNTPGIRIYQTLYARHE